MRKLEIIGNDRPVIGEKEMYSVCFSNGWLTPLIKLNQDPLKSSKIHWSVITYTAAGNVKTGSHKEGYAVFYTFNQKSLICKMIKIIAKQGDSIAELIIYPQRAKISKISKVEILDINYKPIPKGKLLSYKDTIIARAYCIEMFKMQVSFTIWEDDAKGEGHNPLINSFNKLNSIPIIGTVDIIGIAEVVFRLPSYTTAVWIANARIASGDKSEGKTHEYYVTADIFDNKIQKASANVNVINPVYSLLPRQRKWPKMHAHIKPEIHIQIKPQVESSKFPITVGGRSQVDKHEKIINAEFVDNAENRLHFSKISNLPIMKIIAKDMLNKKVKIKIWEEDNLTRKEEILYDGDFILTGNKNFIKIHLLKSIIVKNTDSRRLDYFIEIIHNETSVSSQALPINLDTEYTSALKGRSVTVVEDFKNAENKEKMIIFPLSVKPENDKENKWGGSRNWTAKQGTNMTTFLSSRSKGKRKHAARDLYTKPLETVIAIAAGIVLDVRGFYCETDQVTIRHTLKDGKDFIIRYGELDPKSIKVKIGDQVNQRQELGKTGKLLKTIKEKKIPLMKIGDDIVFMLHFEYFTGSMGFDLKKNPLSNMSGPFNRRADLTDPLAILQEGYRNSFGEIADKTDHEEKLFTEHDARLALMKIFDVYGLEMAKTIESIYRWECDHFKSDQYKHCGSPGMEVSGNKSAPNYGWDSSLYKRHPEYTPTGLWQSYENKGKSGKGGNQQITDKKKKYIKFPSVEAGMMYIADFIIRHRGNVGRWHSLDSTIQQNYQNDIKKAIPKIVNGF